MFFEDIIGNDAIKLQLQISGKAAKMQNTSIPHTFFDGAAGCGKTTMSKALANNQGSDMIKIPPAGMKTSKDMLDLAEKLCISGYTREGKIVGKTNPTIVFFDEIHQMPLSGQEILGIAMEERYIAIKNQYTGEMEEMWLPNFTVIGATTLAGKLSKPFRDRFKLSFHFNTYNLTDSIKIVKKHAELKEINISEKGALAIATRGRGVPRVLVTLLERARDAVLVAGKDIITEEAVNVIFNIMGIDKTGLERVDIKLLKKLYEANNPIGLDTLSILIDESQTTIQNSREPYLMRMGLMVRTGRGRIITGKGVEYLREGGHIETKRRFASE